MIKLTGASKAHLKGNINITMNGETYGHPEIIVDQGSVFVKNINRDIEELVVSPQGVIVHLHSTSYLLDWKKLQELGNG